MHESLRHTYPDEKQSFREWTLSQPPKKILIIRFHAIGDVAITLPSCIALKKIFPDAQIDYLTTIISSPLPKSISIFKNVFILSSIQTRKERMIQTISWSKYIAAMKYDLIIDLQRNWMSRIIRKAARPKAWGEFDRYSLIPAGTRVLETFHKTGGNNLVPSYRMEIHEHLLQRAYCLLKEKGWDTESRLIVLNPAGLYETRNWDIQNYISLAKIWRDNERVQFVFIGTERLIQKVKEFEKYFNHEIINLVNTTSLDEAFALLQLVDGMVSEDSGLMHICWISGVPTLALFGSGPHYWAQPLGSHSLFLHSGDLPCGACMEPKCKFGDVHCLSRYTPEFVFEKIYSLIQTQKPRKVTV